MTRPRLSVVIVAHDSLSELRSTLPPLLDQLGADDELIVVDSGSTDALAAGLSELAPRARLITAPGNVGFAAGANLGAVAASGELLVLLNPDASVETGWAQALRAPWGGEWAAWMALVTMDGGRAINTSGGVLHFTGIGWAGQVGRPVDVAPSGPCEVGFLSGACLAIPRSAFLEAGAFPESFFMYCEDVDLSLRLRLRGGRIGVIPAARVIHSYSFAKGPAKWRALERNRWATVLRTYPGPLLALVLPSLLAAEPAIWAAAARGGWLRMKALATLDVLRMLPGLVHERRRIQATRSVSSAEFAAPMTASLSSPYLGVSNRLIERGLRGYWAVVLAVLGRL